MPNQITLLGAGGGINSPIAIDDVSLRMGPCPPQPMCGFEEGLCGWRQVASGENDVDWERGTHYSPGDVPKG